MAEEQAIIKQEEALSEGMKEMVEAGVFYGRKKSKTHPRMKSAILSNRNGIEIINLEKTKEGLDQALAFLAQTVKTGGTVLVVATQPPAEEMINLAKEIGFPYVDRRWLGGTLTNMRIILGRIEYFKKLKNDFEKNLLGQYTKKERLGMEKELEKMKVVMTGLESFTGRPDAMLVVDASIHMTAIREAKHLKVPVMALVNTDTNPDEIEYPVVGNNKSRTSLNWFTARIAETIRNARKEAAAEIAKKNAEVAGS